MRRLPIFTDSAKQHQQGQEFCLSASEKIDQNHLS